MKAIFLAALVLCMFASNAEARKNYVVLSPECGVSMPCDGGYYSVTAKKFIGIPFGTPLQHYKPQSPRKQVVPRGFTETVSAGRPSRYIAGRLVCAVNVNSALAERGIKGTGSALAHSFDRWGRSSGPQVGAVAVTDRRGGGHVAIVSRVEGGRVWVWNATGGRHGWHEIEYTNRHARYRVASS